MSAPPQKAYLGDSVYAEFDGHSIILSLNNGEGGYHQIIMDPDTLAALEIFRREIAGPGGGL